MASGQPSDQLLRGDLRLPEGLKPLPVLVVNSTCTNAPRLVAWRPPSATEKGSESQ
jgi:hypothetical protein